MLVRSIQVCWTAREHALQRYGHGPGEAMGALVQLTHGLGVDCPASFVCWSEQRQL
jgi:hypothetical protein